MKVSECMCDSVTWVKPDVSICECAKLMAKHKIGCIPVCNDNKNVVGLVTDRDILLRSVCCDKDAKTTPVSDIMTTNVCCCHVNDYVNTAERLMSDNQIRRIPIIDNDKIVGILSIGDISRNPYTNKENFIQTVDCICKCRDKNHQ